MNIGQWKISHKLIGGFAVMILCLLSLGGFSIYRIGTINDAAKLIGSGVSGLSQIAGSRSQLFESQNAVEKAFDEKPGAQREALLAMAAEKLEASLKRWRDYDPSCDPGDERERADKVNALWAPYLDAVKGLREVAASGASKDAINTANTLAYAVAAAMQRNVDYQTAQATDAVTNASATASQSSLLVSVALAMITAFAAGLCILLVRGVSVPLQVLTSVMGRLADSDTQVEIPALERKDELGLMAQTVQIFKSGIVQRFALEASAAETQRASEVERSTRESAKAEAAQQSSFAMESLATGLQRLSMGELAFRLDAAFAPTYEPLRQDFNGAVEKLRDTMRVISSSTSTIRSGTDEISTAADDLSKRTEQQAASLEETAAALDEITATVRKTAQGANHARDVVGQAKDDAEQSGKVVRQAVEAMSGIEKSAAQISQIIGVIDEIAFQTNLLALNAGVEAARAGDAGRGFAVVASEVRALAQRSADAAKEIKALILASGSQVEQGVELVGQTGKALQRIVVQVNEINGIVGEIAASTQEQTIGLDQVNTAVNQMDQVTQQNAAMVEESTAASRALAQETEDLARLLGQLQVGEGPAVSGAGHRTTMRPAKTARPVHKPLAAMRTVGSGGAARKPDPAPAGQDWEEF